MPGAGGFYPWGGLRTGGLGCHPGGDKPWGRMVTPGQGDTTCVGIALGGGESSPWGGHRALTCRARGGARSRLPPGYQPWDQCWPGQRGTAEASSSRASSSRDPRGAMAEDRGVLLPPAPNTVGALRGAAGVGLGVEMLEGMSTHGCSLGWVGDGDAGGAEHPRLLPGVWVHHRQTPPGVPLGSDSG